MNVETDLQQLLNTTSECMNNHFNDFLTNFHELAKVYADSVLMDYKKELYEYIAQERPSPSEICKYICGNDSLIQAEEVDDIPVESVSVIDEPEYVTSEQDTDNDVDKIVNVTPHKKQKTQKVVIEKSDGKETGTGTGNKKKTKKIPSNKSLNELTCPQLRDLLIANNLSKYGVKQILIERLIDFKEKNKRK